MSDILMTSESRTIASPLARKLLAQHGKSAQGVAGSGPRGRILANDVLESLSAVPDGRPKQASEFPQATGEQTRWRTEVDTTRLLQLHQKMVRRLRKNADIELCDILLWVLARELRKHVSADGTVGLLVSANNATYAVAIPADASLLQVTEFREHALNGHFSDEHSPAALIFCDASIHGAEDGVGLEYSGSSSLVFSIGIVKDRPFVVDGALCVRSTLPICLSASGKPTSLHAQLMKGIQEFLDDPESAMFAYALG